MTNTKPLKTAQHEPLAGLIEPFIDSPFDSLPEPLRIRVKRAFPLSWDSWMPHQRRSLAQKDDCQHDPADEEESAYWRAFTSSIWQTEQLLRDLELSNPNGIPSEVMKRKEMLDAAKVRLRNLNALWEKPPFTISDWDNLSDAKLADALRADTKPPAAPAKQADTEPAPVVVEVPASKPLPAIADPEPQAELVVPTVPADPGAPAGTVKAGTVVIEVGAPASEPPLKQRRQEQKILDLLKHQGFNPIDLPYREPGKRGVKSGTKNMALQDTSLFTEKSFENAWQRLRDERRVQGS